VRPDDGLPDTVIGVFPDPPFVRLRSDRRAALVASVDGPEPGVVEEPIPADPERRRVLSDRPAEAALYFPDDQGIVALERTDDGLYRAAAWRVAEPALVGELVPPRHGLVPDTFTLVSQPPPLPWPDLDRDRIADPDDCSVDRHAGHQPWAYGRSADLAGEVHEVECLTIAPGATLRVAQGDTVTLRVSGSAWIGGRIDASGSGPAGGARGACGDVAEDGHGRSPGRGGAGSARPGWPVGGGGGAGHAAAGQPGEAQPGEGQGGAGGEPYGAPGTPELLPGSGAGAGGGGTVNRSNCYCEGVGGAGGSGGGAVRLQARRVVIAGTGSIHASGRNGSVASGAGGGGGGGSGGTVWIDADTARIDGTLLALGGSGGGPRPSQGCTASASGGAGSPGHIWLLAPDLVVAEEAIVDPPPSELAPE